MTEDGKSDSEDWRWHVELEDFIGPWVQVGNGPTVTTEPVANPDRTRRE